MFDPPAAIFNGRRKCDLAMRSNGRRREKGMYQKTVFSIHCNRGARRQDGLAVVFGNIAVG
jgi:hypothetical protein